MGILGNCKTNDLFIEDTWNGAICDTMKPQEVDIFVKGKTGLDAFPGSELEQKLVENDIHTLAVGEFSNTSCENALKLPIIFTLPLQSWFPDQLLCGVHHEDSL